MRRTDLLHRIARLAIVAPRRVIAVAALLALALAIFGVPVAKSLSTSGFQDPTSESAKATRLLTDRFHQGSRQQKYTKELCAQIAHDRDGVTV